jgi:amidohydrolase
VTDAKAAAQAAFERNRDALVDLSHRIHAHPEIKWEEERSSAWVAESLAEAGFAVEAPIGDLPTAFTARAGSGPLHVAICAEYDALPVIGHACGHNVIAAIAVGAGMALAEVADEVGVTVRVIGTPAEEGGGGKILLLERGAFEGAHVAMMAHPGPHDWVKWPIIAAQQFHIQYHGKEAHASAYPELGINALDALTVAQTAIGLLRQHLQPGDRVHGIITRGGDAPNVVPAHTEAEFMVRGTTVADLEVARDRVMRCFEAGALATGATLAVLPRHEPYAEMHHDPDVSDAYRRNAEALGRSFPHDGHRSRRAAGSTDMGNVSLAVPSIHPAIGIDSLPAVNHQPEFAAHCVSEAADRALADAAVALAWTAIDCATDERLRNRLLS